MDLSAGYGLGMFIAFTDETKTHRTTMVTKKAVAFANILVVIIYYIGGERFLRVFKIVPPYK